MFSEKQAKRLLRALAAELVRPSRDYASEDERDQLQRRLRAIVEGKLPTFVVGVLQDSSEKCEHFYLVHASTLREARLLAFAIDGGSQFKTSRDGELHDATQLQDLADSYASVVAAFSCGEQLVSDEELQEILDERVKGARDEV